MKHIIALHREVSMSTSASMFGPAVAMAAEAIERAPDIMMRLRRLQFAERLLPRGCSPLVLVFVGGSRAPSLIDLSQPIPCAPKHGVR